MIKSKGVFSSGIQSVLIRVANLSISFLITVLLARLLGPSHFGTYSVIIAITAIATVPAQMGIPQVIVRETAQALVKENAQLIRNAWSWGDVIVLTNCSVITVIAVVLSSYTHLLDDFAESLSIATMAIVFLCLTSRRGASIRGMGHVQLGQLPESIVRPATMLIVVSTSYWLFERNWFTTETAMYLYLSSVVVSFFVAYLIMIRVSPKLPRFLFDCNTGGIILRASVVMGLSAAIMTINSNFDLLMIRYFTNSTEAGVYRISSAIAIVVVFALQAVNIVIRPKIAELFAKGDNAGVQLVATHAARFSTAGAISVALILVVFGRPFIEIVFGVEYVRSYSAMVILIAGQTVNAVLGSAGVILNMGGHQKYSLIAACFILPTNILLNALMIPMIGIEGAAIATSFSIICWSFLLYVFALRVTGIDSSVLWAR